MFTTIPIKIHDLEQFLEDILLPRYFEAVNEYHAEYTQIEKGEEST